MPRISQRFCRLDVGAVLALLLATAACGAPPAMGHGIGAPHPSEGRTVHAPFARTWSAALEQFAAERIPIHIQVPDSGLLISWITSVPRRSMYEGMPLGPLEANPSAGLWADCGRSEDGRRLEPAELTYTVTVRGDSVSSTVVASGNFRTVYLTDCATTGVLERDLEVAIARRAETF